MNALDFKLEYQQNNDKSSITMPVVIVAAGSSLRMQGINKQLVTLCGVPAIAHTLMAFQQSQYISQIILVTKKEFIADMQSLATKYAVTKLTDIVAGGDSRCKSVLNGLECVKNNKYVMIHDGARPLVTEIIIESVYNKIMNNDCVIPVVPVKDTVKEVVNKTVVKTLNRDVIMSVQTPQAVNLSKYFSAINGADLTAFTDDASIMESCGFKVVTVDGDYENIKITTPEDVVIAEYYLEKRGEE